MSVIISLFNHKGGVSKTTTTFHLGWALADIGYKVLVVDGDPQCNLTGTVLSYLGYEDLSDFYTSKTDNENIQTALSPVFLNTKEKLSSAKIQQTQNKNLFILPGSIKFAENETQLTLAIASPTTLTALNSLPGAFRHLVLMTCKENDIDIVLVDMSPSVGSLNECMLMGSDYFFVPTCPDFYCNQAIYSLSEILPNWNEQLRYFRNEKVEYNLGNAPKFLGIISQKFRPRNGQPVRSFQEWIDNIKTTMQDVLVKKLEPIDMIIDRKLFDTSVPADSAFNLANISDFNSLIAKSQQYSTPVFALNDEQIDQSGTVLKTMKESRDNFKYIFNNLAISILKLTGISREEKSES